MDLFPAPAALATAYEIAPVAHAKLGASGSKKWMACPGSIKASEGRPNTSTDDADRGTSAHEVGAMCLKEGRDAIEMIDRRFGRFVCDEEMAEAVQVYLDHIRSVYRPEEGDLIFVEEPFTLERFTEAYAWPGDQRPDMFGTSDCIIYKPAAQTLHVIDYKNGVGVLVEVYKNPQGRYYGLGAALKLAHLPVSQIVVTIVQPRAFHKDGPVRSETVDAAELLNWSAELMDYAKATLDPNAPRVPGDWCRFCPAKVDCPERTDRAMMVVKPCAFNDDYAVVGQPPEIQSLTNEQISRILSEGQMLVQWFRDVQAEAFNRLNMGTMSEKHGWKLVPKQARRRYIKDDVPALTAALRPYVDTDAEAASAAASFVEAPEDALKMALLMYVDIPPGAMVVEKLKTPAQMEKGLTKEQRKALSAFVEKKSSGATLARADDARAALPPGGASGFDDEYADKE